eukprot:GHVR01157020.1.p1 GENE.GHVR01157020.1~~GHVR01157020.1.p1  ORF type:complete len:770 (-),score=174.62 GHVR01157020.1:529-2838(-)
MKILISLLFGFIIKIFSNGLSGTWTVSDWLNSDVDTTALKGRILAVGDFSSRKKPDIVCASRVGISDSRQLNSVDNRQFESIDAYDISSVDASDISDTSDASSTGGGKVGTSGTSGKVGTSGTSGKVGTSATSGKVGTSATSGKVGTSATSGKVGASATSGKVGIRRLGGKGKGKKPLPSVEKWLLSVYGEDDNGDNKKLIKLSEILLKEENEVPVSAVAADMNFDGRLDLLITFVNNKQYTCITPIPTIERNICTKINLNNKNIGDRVEYKYTVYLQEETGSITYGYDIPGVYSSEPLVMDLNQDYKPDIITNKWNDKKTGVSRVLILSSAGSNTYTTYNFNDNKNKIIIGGEGVNPLSPHHGSAFVDIDGDCLADIVLDVQTAPNKRRLAIWLNKSIDGAPKFESAEEYEKNPILFDDMSGKPSYFDVNSDSTIDIIIPSCIRDSSSKICKNPTLTMHLNKQIGICSHAFQLSCRQLDELCQPSIFNFKKHDQVKLKFKDEKQKNFSLWASTGYPAALRWGDFDSDSVVDVVVLMKDSTQPKSPVVPKQFRVEILENEVWFKEANTFPDDIKNVYANGSLEFGGVVHQFFGLAEGDPYASSVARSLVQTGDNDVFYLRSYSLNGMNPGATFKLCVTDIYGRQFPRIGAQLAQTAYTPLAVPSVFFGLGRTNNYIEYFFLGSPGGQTKHWVSVIPNTDIVAIPYPPSNPDDWTVELSLSPSRHFYRIVVMTTLLLSVLGLIIFCLDRKEKLAEEKIQHDTFRVHYISA